MTSLYEITHGFQSVKSLPLFPPEVIEKILQYLDGCTLAQSRRVCTVWKQLIDNLINRKNIYRTCCLREISSDILIEMLGNRFYSEESQMHTQWSRLYRQWYQMKKVGTWNHKQFTFPVSEESPVTCIKITGSFVVTGHRNGDIHLWDRVVGSHIVKLGHHQKMVLDMALMDLEYGGPYYFPDREIDRQLVISGGKDHVIQVNPIVANSNWLEEFRPFPMPVVLDHHESVECIKTFNNIVLAGCADNSISIWLLQFSNDSSWWPHITPMEVIRGPSNVLRWIGFWNNVITCLCYNAKVCRFNITENTNWGTTRLRRDKIELVISNCFIFRDGIIIFLTVDRHFCVSIDGINFSASPTLKPLKSNVVTVNFVGNLLVLGTETGRVFVYYVNNKEDLYDINLFKPIWTSQVSEASIIDIAVNSSSNGPVVMVATTDALTVIEWCQINEK